MAKELPPLKRSEITTAVKIMAALKQSGSTVEQALRDAFRKNGLDTKAKQDAVFRYIAIYNDVLAEKIDEHLADGVGVAAQIGHSEAAKAVGGERVKGAVLKYDPKRTEKYLALITPENGRGLAAVFTDKMTEKAVKDLRRVTVDVFRRADLDGLTANERHKALQKGWDEAAGDLNTFRFIDQGGKEWENARYLQMLVRTTQARVHREAFADTLVENGDDLVRVSPDGDSCPICTAWAGLIISVSGSDPDFPSYADSLDAGLWHPNCGCQMERMDETVHKEEIQAQKDAPTPDDLTDLDAMGEYRNDAGLPDSEPATDGTDFKEAAMAAYRRTLDKRKSA